MAAVVSRVALSFCCGSIGLVVCFRFSYKYKSSHPKCDLNRLTSKHHRQVLAVISPLYVDLSISLLTVVIFFMLLSS